MTAVNKHNSSASYVEGGQMDVCSYIYVIQHVSHTLDVSPAVVCVTHRCHGHGFVTSITFTTVTGCHVYWIVTSYLGCRGCGVVTSQPGSHGSGVVTSGCVEIFNVQSYLGTKIAFIGFHGLCDENTYFISRNERMMIMRQRKTDRSSR